MSLLEITGIIIIPGIALIVAVVIGIIQINQNKKNKNQELTDVERNDVSRQEAFGRISDIIEENGFPDYLKKVKSIKDSLPEQSIYTVAIRSHIHNQLLGIALLVGGGFAGIGYPGRILQMSLPISDLMGFLPKLIDARDPDKLETAITDFFHITEPNIYGIAISNDEYQIALQTSVFIMNKLEKIKKLIEIRRHSGQDISSYMETDLAQL